MSLLRETIRRLHLRPDAPYPSQEPVIAKAAFDVREMVKQWRESQRMHLVKEEKRDD